MARASPLLAVLFVASCAASAKHQDATEGDDYQKLVKQAATGYSTYTKSGAAALRASGNWKQDMGQYTGHTGGSLVGGFGIKPGNYQEYPDKYTGGKGGSSWGSTYEAYMENYTNGKQYKRYVNKYAGDYDGGFLSGGLSQYMSMDQGVKGGNDVERSFSQYVDKSKNGAGYVAKDLAEYVGQGKEGITGNEKELSKYVETGSKWSSVGASPNLLLEEASTKSTRQGKAAGEAAAYQKAESEATRRAQHRIEELRKLAAEAKANLKSHPADLVSSIESEVQTEFSQERKRLQNNWVAKLHDVNSTALAAAAWDKVEQAFDAVADADEQLRSLDWEELKAMRHAYHERREARESQVRSLSHDARRASHEAKHLGRRVEDRQQSAGVQERVYEDSWAQREQDSERLALEAEEAGDAADAVVDAEFQRVEALLEEQLDALKKAAAEEQRARRLAEGEAKEAVTKARAAARRRSASQDLSEDVYQGKDSIRGNEKELSKDVEMGAKGSSVGVSSNLLLEEASNQSARQGKAAGEAAAYQKAEGEAASTAQHRIKELRKLAAQAKANLKSHPADLVSSIVSEVQTEFSRERKHLRNNWVAKLHDMNSTALAAAAWDEVEHAFDAVADADQQLRSLDWEELKAMRHAYHERREARKSQVRSLSHDARKASHEAKHLGRRVEDRQQSAGVQERVYEHSWAQGEQDSERLALEAEEAGDAADAVVDTEFQRVEALLEERLEALKKTAAEETRARRLAAGKAKEAVTKARAAAQSRSASQASSGSPALFIELAAAGHNSTTANQSTDDKAAGQDAAQRRFSEALAEAEGIVQQLRQLATREHENRDENAAAVVSKILSKALAKVHMRRQQAEREWGESLKALRTAGADAELGRAQEAAGRSQAELGSLDRRQLEAEREAYDHLRRQEDEEVRKIDARARRAIARAGELGRRLGGSDAQDKAGQRGEQLQREADTATRSVEEDQDAKFRLVETLLGKLAVEQEQAVRREQQRRRESIREAEAAAAGRAAARGAAVHGDGEAKSQPASAAAGFLARSDGAMPDSTELLAGATLCLGIAALAGVAHNFAGRRVRLNEQLLLG